MMKSSASSAPAASGTKSLCGTNSTGRCLCRSMRSLCKCIRNCQQRWPRIFSIVVGVILPLFGLIAASLFFGYFLARIEEGGEVEANDASIASGVAVLRFTVAAGNLTANLPRMCMDFIFQYIDQLEAQEFFNTTAIQGELERYIQTVTEQQLSTFATLLFGENITLIYDENGTVPYNGTVSNETFVNGTANPYVDNSTNGVHFESPLFNYTPFDEADPFEVVDNLVNTTATLELMETCGTAAESLNNLLLEGVANAYDDGRLPIDVTFDWVRCDNSSGTSRNTSAMYHAVQQDYVVEQWKQSQKTLNDEYLDKLLGTGVGAARAQHSAREASYRNARGFETCERNFAAAAWFWFTVMTTIGYGNQSPSTEGGRAMVYTLGFLSILAFAGILANAGMVVTTLVDDWNHRTKRNYLNKPWVGCIIWGILYYGWMVVIAVYTQYWKSKRLGEDFSFNLAYWFAYISTTTVGLGDFFYESEVILFEDLFVLPLLFLCGFVLLSNFIIKCTALFGEIMPSRGLANALQSTITSNGEQQTDDSVLASETAPRSPKKSTDAEADVTLDSNDKASDNSYVAVHGAVSLTSGSNEEGFTPDGITQDPAEIA